MAVPQLNALPRALSLVPSSGVQHINVRHTERFTVVGNHLAQHERLSLTAIGLAVHVQSLKAGSIVSIRALAQRFPESEKRIGDAFGELEAEGYIARVRVRLPSGALVTRTFSYNNPYAVRDGAPEPEPVPVPKAAPPEPVHQAESPEPDTASPEAHRLLAGLRATDPRLLLSPAAIGRLAPGVDRWLERGIAPSAVHRTLTAALPPGPIPRPAGLLAYRLDALLPPPLPPTPVPAAEIRPDPLQNCDGCDRAFRAPEPGSCRTCEAAGALTPAA
ncbi:helix-turn-helix domain-containing protein [Streptomyces sp. NPDC049597]|uniref:helix-turn-helix domain-containing protein n=1 Tax=Streptomyces sp. NPDC049597 TaxID=3155276 RepID=UPI003414DEEB